jgi:hypothetical protein
MGDGGLLPRVFFLLTVLPRVVTLVFPEALFEVRFFFGAGFLVPDVGFFFDFFGMGKV